jgi:hypothetical protein
MTISASLAEYKEAIRVSKEDHAKSENVQSRDSSTGTTVTKSCTLGFVEQPFLQFTIGSKFTIRAASFEISATSTVLQTKNFYQTSTTISKISDFEVSQAKKLISHQAPSYQRLIEGSDFGYAKDLRRQADNAFLRTAYFLIQVDANATTPLMGVKGRFEVSAEESVNIQSRTAHYVSRCAKTMLAECEDYQVNARTGIAMVAGTSASVRATTTLSLDSALSSSLNSKGTTSVSALGPTLINGAVVQINMGGGAGFAKAVINLDNAASLLEGVASGKLPSTLLGLNSAIASGLGVVASALPIPSNPLVSDALNSFNAFATGGPEALLGEGINAVTKIGADVVSGAVASIGVPTEIADAIGSSSVQNGTQAAVIAATGTKPTDIATQGFATGLISSSTKPTDVSSLIGGSAQFLQGTATAQVQNLLGGDTVGYLTGVSDLATTLVTGERPIPLTGEELASGRIPPPPTPRQVPAYKGSIAPGKLPPLADGPASLAPYEGGVIEETPTEEVATA